MRALLNAEMGVGPARAAARSRRISAESSSARAWAYSARWTGSDTSRWLWSATDWRATAVSMVSASERIASESVTTLARSRSVRWTITNVTATTPTARSATNSSGSVSRRRAWRVLVGKSRADWGGWGA